MNRINFHFNLISFVSDDWWINVNLLSVICSNVAPRSFVIILFWDMRWRTIWGTLTCRHKRKKMIKYVEIFKNLTLYCTVMISTLSTKRLVIILFLPTLEWYVGSICSARFVSILRFISIISWILHEKQNIKLINKCLRCIATKCSRN